MDFSDSSMDSNTTNNRDNGGTILRINSIKTRGNHPQGHNNKGPSLYDHTTKLEDTLAQFMPVSKSNQKSTESAIKNLEV